ncbi:hypothetical protein CC777_002010 [Salmonella enterica subsp. enterica serovar Paratyphi C]|nr:hypothetical protein [Salmonella enterica subsp. enterica serovar Paratyphi C]
MPLSVWIYSFITRFGTNENGKLGCVRFWKAARKNKNRSRNNYFLVSLRRMLFEK